MVSPVCWRRPEPASFADKALHYQGPCIPPNNVEREVLPPFADSEWLSKCLKVLRLLTGPAGTYAQVLGAQRLCSVHWLTLRLPTWTSHELTIGGSIG